MAIPQREVGYVSNMLAGSLASNKSRLVAILLPTIANSIFADTVQALTDRLAAAGYQTLLGLTGYRPEQEEALLSRQGEDRVWFLAVAGDRPVGMCKVDRVHTRARLRHRASLGLVVLKDWWGQGIGRQLMAHAIAWAQEQGFEQLELDVIAGNDRAQSLYRSLGFVETGRMPKAFKYQDGTYADDVLMVRVLKG